MQDHATADRRALIDGAPPTLEQRLARARALLGERWVGHAARRVRRLRRPLDSTAATVLRKVAA